jgi:hypothetical protein
MVDLLSGEPVGVPDRVAKALAMAARVVVVPAAAVPLLAPSEAEVGFADSQVRWTAVELQWGLP